jgi:hypothetical protein
MSDYAHGVPRSKLLLPHRSVECRALYGACYLLFLGRAVLKRTAPWRRSSLFGDGARRESIFSEAATAASVIVSSSFMGL